MLLSSNTLQDTFDVMSTPDTRGQGTIGIHRRWLMYLSEYEGNIF